MSNSKRIYPHVVNLATDVSIVNARSCKLWGIYVNTQTSNHPIAIENAAGVAQITVPASIAAGEYQEFPGVLFVDGLTVDPDDAATGNITLFIEPVARA